MAYIIDLPTFGDDRGKLTIIEKALPFEIKRFYYVYDVKSKRGGHRHHKTLQALVCLGGSCEIYTNNGNKEETFFLDHSDKCLIVQPEDWHTMDKFTNGSTLLVFASEYYDVNDYIDEPYQ
ncbi:MAG: FdtA/QdtA family cupin domain-containing protein [Sulfurimonas sp.]|jgi:dTDP-4-dehydrorhamnose 3,5-epimerase-like enzyme